MKLAITLSVCAFGMFVYTGCMSERPVVVDGLVAYYPFEGNGRDMVGPHNLCPGNNPENESPQDVKADSIQGFTWKYDFLGFPSKGCYLDGTASASPTGLKLFNSFSIVFRAKPEGAIGLFPDECNFGNNIAKGAKYPFVVFPGWSPDNRAGVGIAVGTDGLIVFEHAHDHFPATAVFNNELGTVWHDFAVTVQDNGAPKVFVDGRLVRTGAVSRKVKELRYGSNVGGDAYGHFKGELRGLAFYNRALSDQEVKALAD